MFDIFPSEIDIKQCLLPHNSRIKMYFRFSISIVNNFPNWGFTSVVGLTESRLYVFCDNYLWSPVRLCVPSMRFSEKILQITIRTCMTMEPLKKSLPHSSCHHWAAQKDNVCNPGQSWRLNTHSGRTPTFRLKCRVSSIKYTLLTIITIIDS